MSLQVRDLTFLKQEAPKPSARISTYMHTCDDSRGTGYFKKREESSEAAKNFFIYSAPPHSTLDHWLPDRGLSRDRTDKVKWWRDARYDLYSAFISYRSQELLAGAELYFDANMLMTGDRCFLAEVKHNLATLFQSINSTQPVFPPETISQKFLDFGDLSSRIAEKLRANESIRALGLLQTLNNSLRYVVLSNELPEGISETLDNVLRSLESCKQIIYDEIRGEASSETTQTTDIMAIVESFGKLFEAYADIDTWREKMVTEWSGGNRS